MLNDRRDRLVIVNPSSDVDSNHRVKGKVIYVQHTRSVYRVLEPLRSHDFARIGTFEVPQRGRLYDEKDRILLPGLDDSAVLVDAKSPQERNTHCVTRESFERYIRGINPEYMPYIYRYKLLMARIGYR